MIAKCIVLFAIVAQISATSCNSACAPKAVVAPTCGSSAVPVAASSGVASGAIIKNVVAKGKYPVALRNCGPTPDRQIPVTTTRVNHPAQVKPTVRLPCNIPAPRTICHTCTCYKTVLRPRVNQQIISVPTLERYIQTTHKPVIENIQYEAIPVNCGDESASTGELQFVEVGGSSAQSCGAPAPVVPVPTCSAPAPVVPVPTCSAPAPVVPVPPCSAPAPAVPVPTCSAPAPVVPVPTCSAPAPVVPTCSAPVFDIPQIPVAPTCSAPAPVVPVQTCAAPAPVVPTCSAPIFDIPQIPVQTCAAPAPVVPSCSAPAFEIPQTFSCGC